MSGLFRELNWSLIATLFIVSAVVAWLGDIIGMKLGKKRITIFGIRPKYTTRIMAIFTGLAIAFATLFVSALSSESVREAIFSMKNLQNQISTLTTDLKINENNLSSMKNKLSDNQKALQEKQSKLVYIENKLTEGTKKLAVADKQLKKLQTTQKQLEKDRNAAFADKARLLADKSHLTSEKAQLTGELGTLKDNIETLRDESEDLKSSVHNLREGRIAAFSGEILAQGVVDDAEQLTDARINDLMVLLTEQCREMLAQRFGQASYNIPAPKISSESEKQVRSKLKSSKGRYLIRLSAVSNAVYGEPVDVEAEIYSSSRVYKTNELLSKIKFNSSEKRADVETKIYNALREINRKAVKDGVLRDPISGNVGSVDSAELSYITKKITESSTACTLEMRTVREIFTEGPVIITLKLK